MEKMKKLTALLLAAATAFTLSYPAFAIDEDTVSPDIAVESQVCEIPDAQISEEAPDVMPDSYTDEENAVDDTAAEKSAVQDTEPASGDEDSDFIFDKKEPVAILYLCVSGPTAHYGFGHTWICIRNISAKDISVGSQIIHPRKMISAGLHHNGGIHFNDELRQYDKKAVTALSKNLTIDGLEKAEKEMLKSTWRWYELFVHNCTNFATSVWLAATGQFFLAFCFPFVVQIQMAFNKTEKLSIAAPEE